VAERNTKKVLTINFCINNVSLELSTPCAMVSGVEIFIIETAGVLPDRLFFCGWEAPFPSCSACWRGHRVMDELYICVRRASIAFSTQIKA